MCEPKCSIFDAPFKDYTLVASDGREIPVHRCVLYGESDFFKALFTNKMMQENRLETKFDYDVLMLTVQWMYGYNIIYRYGNPITYKVHINGGEHIEFYKVYEVADMFGLSAITDIGVDITGSYIERFSSIVGGKETPTMFEASRYNSMYEEYLIRLAYAIDYEDEFFINIYSFPSRMLVDLVKSRIDCEFDAAMLMLENDDEATKKILIDLAKSQNTLDLVRLMSEKDDVATKKLLVDLVKSRSRGNNELDFVRFIVETEDVDMRKSFADLLLPLINLHCLHRFEIIKIKDGLYTYTQEKTPDEDSMVIRWMEEYNITLPEDAFVDMPTYKYMLHLKTGVVQPVTLFELTNDSSYEYLSDLDFYYNDPTCSKKLRDIIREDEYTSLVSARSCILDEHERSTRDQWLHYRS